MIQVFILLPQTTLALAFIHVMGHICCFSCQHFVGNKIVFIWNSQKKAVTVVDIFKKRFHREQLSSFYLFRIFLADVS